MPREPVPSKADLVAMIRAVASEAGATSLSRREFLTRSGLSQWSVDKHFDSWSDACQAAGVTTAPTVAQRPRSQEYSDAECVNELRRVAALLGMQHLSSKQFGRYARISASTVARRFGGWSGALSATGLTESPRAVAVRQLSPDYCVQELKRVANELGRDYLTAKEFNERGEVSAHRVVRAFGSWHEALRAANLQPSPNFKRQVPLADLAADFLRATVDLARVPSLVQLTRRSKYVSHTFGGRHGGYGQFKRLAIDYILSRGARMPPAIRELLEAERRQLAVTDRAEPDFVPTPHRQGRTLNFRAFAYSPTSEHDVVQMFGAVADELGFEIVGNRSAFPDCEARRRGPGARETFMPCLIEYEFASSDFRRHGHPSVGCDLVVCWEHDWKECPIEVLELKDAIRSLPGWR